MQNFDFIYVFVVYRNTNDLKDVLKTIVKTPGTYRAVVVNNFYDEESKAAVEAICRENGCDFLNEENRGYGAGNNAGIAYATEHFRFRYLIVSNPDIEIVRFPAVLPESETPEVFGPEIRTLTGKRQNPCMVLSSPLRESLLRIFAKRPENTLPFYLAIAVNKAERIAYHFLFSKKGGRVYSLHGSFLIFSAKALEHLGLPFDPEMFLFREEDYLARSAKKLGIRMRFLPAVQIRHKEDGSVGFISEKVREHTVRSLRTYFGLR